MWKEQRRYAQKSNYYSCDIFHNHGCHENGKMARESEFPGRLIPIPSEISAQCGLAWKCVEQSEEETENFLKKRNWPGMASIVFWYKTDIVCCM